ncbi:hypothetical protein C8R43DRAFT_1039185 [Mycena crocata]|nr:hypothetical protein C8R43DRAFT_1039185 [Mycena crocata]
MTQFESLTAPILAGTQANWALLGTLTLQVYKFHICFPKEKTWIKSLVYGVFFLEILQTAITSHFAYSLLVTGWGNPDAFVHLAWSSLATPIFTGITSATVQLFFAWRIYVLKGQSIIYRAITALIVMVALMQSLAAIISDSRFAVTTDVNEIPKLILGVKVGWPIGSAVCDVIITVTMLVILTGLRKLTPWTKTSTLIEKLQYNIIQTGAITSIVAIFDVTLFLVFPANNLHQTPAFMLGKLYSNVLLVTLNARALTGTPSVLAADRTGAGEDTGIDWRRNTTNGGTMPTGPQKVRIRTETQGTSDSGKYPPAGEHSSYFV